MKRITKELVNDAVDFVYRYKILIGERGYSTGMFNDIQWEHVSIFLAIALYQTGILDRKKSFLNPVQIEWLYKQLYKKYSINYIDGFEYGCFNKENYSSDDLRFKDEIFLIGVKDGKECKEGLKKITERTRGLAKEKLSKNKRPTPSVRRFG